MIESKNTKINAESLFERINKFKNTTLNRNSAQSKIPDLTGKTLNGGYRIINRLANTGGEADIYNAKSLEGKQYIVKIYHRKESIKDEIAKKLSAIDNPYIGKIASINEINGYKYTVVPFYEGISVADSIKQGYIYTHNEWRKNFQPQKILMQSILSALKKIFCFSQMVSKFFKVSIAF